MKKFFLFFFLVFLLFPLISAVEFTVHDSYQQGETMIAKVSGNFVTQITENNVFFYKGHVRIPMDWGMAKINEDYYIYASLVGKTEGNYSVSIEGVKYMKGNEVIQDDIVKNFTITNSTASFSLAPGVVASSSGFSLEVQNLQDNQITVDAVTHAANNSERDISIQQSIGTAKEISFSLKSGEIKNIDFVIGNGLPTFQTISFSSGNLTYEVPVYIFSSSGQQGQTPQSSLMIQPSEAIYSIPTNNITTKTFYLYNTGGIAITNISLSLSDGINAFVNLSQTIIDNLEPNSNIPIKLSFFSPGETDADGTLKAISGDIISYSSISLNFLNDYIPPNETIQSYTTMTCAEAHGTVCTSTQQCDAETVYAKDNVCCLGNCSTTQSSGSPWTGRIIAIAIVVIIGVLAVWFYFKKFKTAKKPIDLLKIGKKN